MYFILSVSVFSKALLDSRRIVFLGGPRASKVGFQRFGGKDQVCIEGMYNSGAVVRIECSNLFYRLNQQQKFTSYSLFFLQSLRHDKNGSDPAFYAQTDRWLSRMFGAAESGLLQVTVKLRYVQLVNKKLYAATLVFVVIFMSSFDPFSEIVIFIFFSPGQGKDNLLR